MENYENRHYGLTGKVVKVRQSDSKSCPWGRGEVPVRITGEYDSYLCGTVMPHRNRKGMAISRPYPITLSKHDLFLGEALIIGGNDR